jgi:prepilin-type N-terminal cleavage/methylation domain-containing protein
MASPHSRRSRGFTLIELMITVSVVAIFSSLAAPGFRTLIAKQRLTSAASALSESLWLGRSEALKRNTDVSFKFTSASAGWNLTLGSDGTGTTLHSQDGFSAISSSSSGGAATIFSFNNYGRLASTGWVQLSNSTVGVYKCVTVSSSGRTTVTDAACS